MVGKQPPHEKIGVVDTQWIVHQGIPSLGDQVINRGLIIVQMCSYVHCLPIQVLVLLPQGQAQGGRAPWEGVCNELLCPIWFI